MATTKRNLILLHVVRRASAIGVHSAMRASATAMFTSTDSDRRDGDGRTIVSDDPGSSVETRTVELAPHTTDRRVWWCVGRCVVGALVVADEV